MLSNNYLMFAFNGCSDNRKHEILTYKTFIWDFIPCHLKNLINPSNVLFAVECPRVLCHSTSAALSWDPHVPGMTGAPENRCCHGGVCRPGAAVSIAFLSGRLAFLACAGFFEKLLMLAL